LIAFIASLPRRILQVLVSLLALILLLLTVLILLGQQPEGARWLLQQVIPLADSAPENSPVSVTQIEGQFPQNIVLHGLVLRDAEGQWLSVSKTVLRWSPWALLKGELQLTEVLVDGVQVQRLPVAQEAKPTAAEPRLPTWPQLPFAVQLDQLALKNVQLAKAVLGEAVLLELRSQLRMEVGQSLQAHLSLVRQDRRGEALQWVLNWQRKVGLQSDLNLVSPQGGLVAQRLLADASAVQLSLTGRGPLAEWQAELEAELEGWGVLEGDIGADLRLPQQLKIQFSLRPGDKLPSEYQGVLGQRVALALDVAYDWQSPLVLRQFELQTALADLSLHGVLSPRLQLSKTALTLDIKQPDLLSPWLQGVEFQRGQLKAALSGALAQPKLEAQLKIKQAKVVGVAEFRELLTTLKTDLAKLAPITLKLQAKGSRFESAPLQALLADRLTLDLEADLDRDKQSLDLAQIRLRTPLLTLQGKANGTLDGQQGQVTLQGNVSNISQLMTELNFPAEGQLHLDLAGSLKNGAYQLSFASELQKLLLQQASLQPLLGSEVSLKLESRGTLAGAVRLSQLQLKAAQVNLEARGELSEDQSLGLNLALKLDDLQPLAADLRGAGLLNVALGGSLQQPSFQLALQSDQLRWQQHRFDNLQGELNFSNLLGAGKGKLMLKSAGSLGKLSLRSGLQRSESGDMAVSGLRLQAPDLDLNADLILPAAGLPVQGKGQLSLASMKFPNALVGLSGEGALKGRADLDLLLSAEGEKQNLQLTLRGKKLQFAAHKIAEMTLQGKVQDLFKEHHLDLSLQAKSVQSGSLQQGELTLSLKGQRDEYDLESHVQGELPGRLDLKLISHLSLQEQQPSLSLTSLEGWLAEQKVALLKPLEIRLGEQLGWNNLELAVGEGRLQSRLQMSPDSLAFSLAIKQLPLALSKLLLPEQVWLGQLDGELSLLGRAKNPKLELQLTLSGLQLEDSPEFDVELGGSWAGKALQVTAELQGPLGEPLRLSATLPVKAAGERHLPQLQQNRSVQAALDWRGDIAPLWHLLPLPEHKLSGQAVLDLKLGGTVLKPVWQGGMALSQARYENLSYGTLLSNLNLRADLEEAKRLQLTLTAQDGKRGRLSVTGPLGLLESEKTDLKIVVSNALLLRSDAIRLRADADLHFLNQGQGYLLRGRAEAKSVLVNLEQQLPASVVDLDVIELDDEAIMVASEEPLNQTTPVKLDLQLAMPRAVYLRGRGLESEWGGSLKIKGDSQTPRVSGRLQVLNGDFTFVGRQFDFERGSIEFYGSDQIDPQLDFLLSHPSASMNTQFLLAGLSSKPTLTLSSDDPNLPEDEVLSKMLFDKGSTDLSPLEVLELTQAVAELSGLLNGGGGGISLDSILGALRQAFGFDVLRIRSGDGEGEGATVDVGKYLSDSVYVGVRQGAQPEDSEVTVEIEVTPDVKFESRIGEANKNRSSLSWEWDY